MGVDSPQSPQRRRRALLAGLAGGALGLASWGCLGAARFGALPDAAETASFARSPHFRDGLFHYEIPTPVLVGKSGPGAWLRFLLARRDRLEPEAPLPVVRTDLRSLPPDADLLIWLGHASFFLQLSGLRLLIDPVCSRHAAPLPVSVRAFPGTSLYVPADFPDIDAILLTHDHWDHMDCDTLTALVPRTGRYVTGLGMGAHLRRFGIPAENILEGDWGDSFAIPGGTWEVAVRLVPARHYSGRMFSRNRALWTGFHIRAGAGTVFCGGDSGYGPHFARLGRELGGCDLALLDCGQYDAAWPHVHMKPEETVRAAEDLGARALLPMHIGRFAIAHHAWDEPFERVAAASVGRPFSLLTPRIGEPVPLDAPDALEAGRFLPWWRNRGRGQGFLTPVPARPPRRRRG